MDPRRARHLSYFLAVLASLVLVAPSAGAVHGQTNATTLTMAEAPGASANFILPFMNCNYDSTNNTEYFQRLMFRPLYWVGLGTSQRVQYPLSLAGAPQFTNGGRTVTITMKGWRFANGDVVDAASVKFYLDLYRADPTGDCAYQAGVAIPDQLTNVRARGNQLELDFAQPQNPTILLYRYLSQITALPPSWDRTTSGPITGCEAGVYGSPGTDNACTHVVSYLSSLASTTSSFTSQFWQGGVDGPWRLASFDAVGNASFNANARYSGPQRPRVNTFREAAYANAPAVLNALTSGAVDLAMLSPSQLTPSNHLTQNGNASRFRVVAAPPWSINFAVVNFSPGSTDAAIVNQLYIRQALQSTVDQASLIADFLGGYGVPTVSPIPASTPPFMSPPISPVYAFDPVRAEQLLTQHGWSPQSGGLTCRSPGTGPSDCGAGIAFGEPLELHVVWSSGDPTLTSVMSREVAQWSALGIHVTSSQDAPGNLTTDCLSASSFDLCTWGGGWSFLPSLYPSGEAIFATTGAVSNFSDPTLSTLVTRSLATTAALGPYAAYAARELPVIYEPAPDQTYEVALTLRSTIGLAPNPLHSFTPEYYW